MNTVFVYGLLKPGFRLHHIVAPFVARSAPATTRGRLYDAGVPAARFDEEGDIEGLVMWLRDEQLEDALRILDDLEDEGEMYRRVVIDAMTDEGPVRAHAYHYLPDVDPSRDVGRAWR